MINFNGIKAEKIIMNGQNIRCRYNGTDMVDSIVTSGLVLWLDGKDFTNSPPTNPWFDKSGLNNNATPYNFDYTTTDGSNGLGGIVMDGVNDKLLTSLKFDLTTQFSISVKFKFVSLNLNKQTLWSYNDGDTLAPNYHGIQLGISANLTQLVFENYNDTSIYLTSNLVAGTTYIIDLVKRVDGKYYLYVNNVLIGSQTAQATTMNVAATFRVGYYPYAAGSEFLKETVYRVLSYNRELTDGERLQNYYAT